MLAREREKHPFLFVLGEESNRNLGSKYNHSLEVVLCCTIRLNMSQMLMVYGVREEGIGADLSIYLATNWKPKPLFIFN